MIKLRELAGYALGINTIRATARAARRLLWNESAQFGVDVLKEGGKTLFKPDDEEHRHESFMEAVNRLGLSEDALRARCDALRFQESVLRAFGYISIVSGLAAGWFAESFFWFVLLLIQSLAISAMFFGSCFVKAFRAWQTERRVLATPGEFVAAGGIYRVFLGGT